MDEFNKNIKWKLTRIVLPQHTDHAGVMWHGSYFNFLEEARIDALSKVGISYSNLSQRGYEIPLISARINYKISFLHGENFELISQFMLLNKIRLKCKTSFMKQNGDVGAESLIDLVVIKKQNGSIKFERDLPSEIKNALLLLQHGS